MLPHAWQPYLLPIKSILALIGPNERDIPLGQTTPKRACGPGPAKPDLEVGWTRTIGQVSLVLWTRTSSDPVATKYVWALPTFRL